MRIFLEMERILLREFAATDLQAFIDLNADVEVMRHLTGIAMSPDRVRNEILPEFLRLHVETPDFGYWAGIEKCTGDFIGWFKFRHEDRPESGVELGY
jgi:RimJ/RimL family protein N-acetyltransferase